MKKYFISAIFIIVVLTIAFFAIKGRKPFNQPQETEEQLEDYKETEGSTEECPDFTASDYVKPFDYHTEESVKSDFSEYYVTDEMVKRYIFQKLKEKELIEKDMEFTDDWSITEEQVSILSDGKYTKIKDLESAVKTMLGKKQELEAKEQVYNQIIQEASPEITDIPEEVLDYELNDPQTLQEFASSCGMSLEALKQVENDNGTIAGLEDYVKQNLSEEILYRYIAEQEGISVTDEDREELYQMVAYKNAQFSVDAIREEYGDDFLEKQALKIKVIEKVTTEKK